MGDILIAPPTVTLSAAADFSQRLQAAVAAGDAVALNLDQVTEVDLSFVQIVQAARQQAADDNKRFSLTGAAPAAVETLLRRAGFLDAPSAADRAFWLAGAEAQ